MKICVVGCGYVGLVTAACLAELGHTVICVDVDYKKIAGLNAGKLPIFEPGLEELVARNRLVKRLSFSASIKKAVERSEVDFIAVGTPSQKNGEADVSAVEAVAHQIAGVLRVKKKIALNLRKSRRQVYKVIVNKSTVPVGMGDIVTKIFLKQGVPKELFAVVSNPEFLREGSAIADFMHPDRIVIGASDNKAFNVITELYRPLNAHIVFTTIKSAELIKYASNAFLATKISFINEIANICEKFGADVCEVADAVGLDKRIGRHFLNAGLGWGGSCFPKDVAALIYLARSKGYNPRILEACASVNQAQIERFVSKIKKYLKEMKGKIVTVLGLSFKPHTDDLREAPALKAIEFLLAEGAEVKVYDPIVKDKNRLSNLPHAYSRLISEIALCGDPYAAAKGSEALIVVTEWPEFREIDFKKIKSLMKNPNLFDGRNMFKPAKMREAGFKYYGVGR